MYFFVTTTQVAKNPITDVWDPVILRSIWFTVHPTALPAYFVQWLVGVFFSTHHRAEPKRCPESTSIFYVFLCLFLSCLKSNEENTVDKSVSFLKHLVQSSLSYFLTLRYNSKHSGESLAYRVMFLFSSLGESDSKLPSSNVTNYFIPGGTKSSSSQCLNISTDDLS